MTKKLDNYLSQIEPLDDHAMELANMRWDHVAKPLHSLGVLEKNVIKIAGICKRMQVDISKRALVIICGDNGIVEEGVTQTGQEVTALVAENMINGNSSVCIMADRADTHVYPVDMGVARDLHSGSVHPLLDRKIAYGTKNFHREPAMTREETIKAITAGIEIVEMLSENGYGLIATGEMGIGNTTTSSATACLLLKKKAKEMTGRGAGLNDEGLKRKIKVIDEAIARYEPECGDAIDILSKVGGFDLAGLAGIFLGGAIYRIPVLIDGFISGTAALAAAAIHPGAADYMIASHVSAEPAGRLILDALLAEPMIQAGMCLGEGTGAVAAIPLLDMAVDVYTKMSTFQEISIEDYKPLGGQSCSH